MDPSLLLTAQLFMIDWFSEPGPHLSISIDYFLSLGFARHLNSIFFVRCVWSDKKLYIKEKQSYYN